MKRLPWWAVAGSVLLAATCASANAFREFRETERRAFDAFRGRNDSGGARTATEPTAPPDAESQTLPPASPDGAGDEAAAQPEAVTIHNSDHFSIRFGAWNAPDEIAELAGLYEQALAVFVRQQGLRDPRPACALEDGRIVITVDNALANAGQASLEGGHWNGTFWLNEQLGPDVLRRFQAASWVLFAIQHATGDSASARRWLGTALRETGALGWLTDEDAVMLLEANPLKPAYFQHSIQDDRNRLTGRQLEHGTTHFLYDLVHDGGVGFKDVFEAVMPRAVDVHIAALQGAIAAATGRSLGDAYRDFVRRSFLGGRYGPAVPPHQSVSLQASTRRVSQRFTLPANCTAGAWRIALQRGPESLAPRLALILDAPLPAGVHVEVFDPAQPVGTAPVCTISPGGQSAVIGIDDLVALLILVVNTADSDCELSMAVARYGITIQPPRQVVLDLAVGVAEGPVDFEAHAEPSGEYRVEWDFGDGESIEQSLAPEDPVSTVTHDYTALKQGQIFKPVVALFDAAADSDTLPLARDGVTVTVHVRDDAADWECGVDLDWSHAEKVDVDFETYYRIWDTSDGDPGRPVRHGPRWLYHDKGKHLLMARGCYQDGVIVGRWTSWFRDGAVNSELRYREGKVVGPVKRWWENGHPRTAGTLIAQHHDSIWEVELGVNIWDGLFEAWYESGKPQRATLFRMGVKDGKHRSWYENGQLEFETDYKDNRKHGAHRHWKEDGTPVHEYQYQNDQLHGIQVNWSNWGERQDCTYEQGEQRGIWRRHAADGRVLWRSNPPWDPTGAPWRDAATHPPPGS